MNSSSVCKMLILVLKIGSTRVFCYTHIYSLQVTTRIH